jgi:hypothetical protein
MAKISLKSYFEPTPVNIRKFADALLVGLVYIQMDPSLLGDKWTRFATLGIVAMKVLSNFFTVSPGQAEPDPNPDPNEKTSAN